MKPTDKTEDFVRRGKAGVTTGARMDKRVLEDSFAAMDESSAGRLSPIRIILQSRAARLAAAAVIIIAVGLVVNQSSPPEQAPPPISTAARSPAEMLSVMSLNMAYRRGGIEAVDDVSNEAFKALGSKPAKVSLAELLAESNGA